VPHTAIKPHAYAEPVHSAPLHDEPLYGHASQAVLSKTPYRGELDHYTPALAAPLMANAYQGPILKSSYVPEYAPVDYGHYATVPAAHAFGARLYNPGYYPGY